MDIRLDKDAELRAVATALADNHTPENWAGLDALERGIWLAIAGTALQAREEFILRSIMSEAEGLLPGQTSRSIY